MRVPSLLTAAVLTASVFAAASPAAAHGRVSSELFYYENGQIVGGDVIYCDGHRDFWGDMTVVETTFTYYGCD